MFASKETRDKREADAAAEWIKAKAVWRRIGKAAKLIGLLCLLVFVYYAGERSGFLACKTSRDSEMTQPR